MLQCNRYFLYMLLYVSVWLYSYFKFLLTIFFFQKQASICHLCLWDSQYHQKKKTNKTQSEVCGIIIYVEYTSFINEPYCNFCGPLWMFDAL